MGYTGIPYTIKSGDTLWDIARQELGDPYGWPRLFAFNTQPDVIAAGARKIEDPDLIYAGATLMLPIIQGTPKPAVGPSATAQPQVGTLKDQIPTTQMPMSIAYDIQGGTITLDYGTYIARVAQKGRILLNPGTKVPLTAVLNGGFELNSKTEAESSFAKLVADSTVTFDPATKAIKFTNKMISSANNIAAPKTEIGIEMSSISPMPVLKAAIAYPELKGTIGADSYVTFNYKIEVEIEPRMVPPRVPQMQPISQPVSSPVRRPETDWWAIARDASIGALVLGATVTVAYGASVALSGGGTTILAPAYASAMTAVLLVGTTATAVSVTK